MIGALGPETVIGVAGAGAMGAGIAQVAAAAGHEVLLYDAHPGVADMAKARTADALARLTEKGRMAPDQSGELLDRIRICRDLTAFADAGLVIEAVVEEAEAKKELFRQVEGIVGEACILASNTSSLSITELASVLQDPSRFAGLHFFNPAAVMPLVEVVKGLRTSVAVVDLLVDVVRAWGKTPVVAKNAPGFIVNKGARPFYGEALRFLEEGGADVATIDSLMRAAGFKMGPFELIDLIGLDINLAVGRQMWQAYYCEPRYQPSMLVEEMVAAGYLGRKSGRGFYDYSDGAAKPEPKVMPPCKPPTSITVFGDLGPASGLIPLLRTAGIEIREAMVSGTGHIEFVGTRLGLTDGHVVPARHGEWIYFDLALDYTSCEHLAIASHSAKEESLRRAAGLFQAAGKKVSTVQDVPGMIVARTLTMLVNEAADTLSRGVGNASDIDLAMQKGLGWPGGPLGWSDKLGSQFVWSILDGIRESYGDQRYRPNVLLTKLAAAGDTFNV